MFSSVPGLPAKTMLCQCAYNAAGDMVGVIQAINKKNGVFTSVSVRAQHYNPCLANVHSWSQEDEFLLERLCGQAGALLFHSEVLGVMDKSSKARFKVDRGEQTMCCSAISPPHHVPAAV
jgi:hypothetical protein